MHPRKSTISRVPLRRNNLPTTEIPILPTIRQPMRGVPRTFSLYGSSNVRIEYMQELDLFFNISFYLIILTSGQSRVIYFFMLHTGTLVGIGPLAGVGENLWKKPLFFVYFGCRHTVVAIRTFSFIFP
eukprot:GEMP01049490.1.p1 GENE.GEMP01049490.1~~GEMP01049490.1.p1  ORF type:complete len:128 (-),score=1.91 GEMP01049490.1:1006-1389(-)